MGNKKPIQKFKAGAIDASVWENSKQINGVPVTVYAVTLDRKYKDKNGTWQSTSSLNVNDIPKAIVALEEAYKSLVMKDANGNNGNSSNAEVEDV